MSSNAPSLAVDWQTPEEEVNYTARQIELIRARIEAYYDLHQTMSRKASWVGVADQIFEETKVLMDDEVLRQFVQRVTRKTKPPLQRVTRKKKPRIPNPENLRAIVSFLLADNIGLLTREELEAPEIPYRLAQFLLDFLRHPTHDQAYPPEALAGSYLALIKDADGSDRTRIQLDVQVSENDHIIRLSEITEVFSVVVEADFDAEEISDPQSVLNVRRYSEGWGVITPEENVLIFMKRERYGYNHYYLTIALHPPIWSETSALHFALLRHAYPVPDDPNSKTFEDLIKETDGDTVLLHFNKHIER